MGGRISQVFYNLYPERVKTLSLIATFTGHDFSDVEKQKFVDLRLKPLVEDGKEVSDIAPVVAKTLVGPHATKEQYQQLVKHVPASARKATSRPCARRQRSITTTA